jgi:hypothetical protein
MADARNVPALKIAILDHDKSVSGRLADVPLSLLLWNDPDHPGKYFPIPDKTGTIADLGPDDDLLIYPSTKVLWGSYRNISCRLTLLFEEPRAVHGKYSRTLPLLWWRYFRIFSNDRRVVRLFPNARYLASGNATVSAEPTARLVKTRRMSLIASEKRFLKGHALRHEIADWIKATEQDADLMGRGYKPFDRREDGFVPYQFSVVIENSQQSGYFTEKLIDAFLCDTIPIYWGAPDIGSFFDTRGMIICQTGHDIKQVVSSLTAEDYARLEPIAMENRIRAMQFASYKSNAIRALLGEVSAS